MGGSLGSILNPTFQFLEHGFDSVDALPGLVIALFAVVLMKTWRELFLIALAAVAIYFVVDAVLPVIVQNKGVRVSEIKLPNPMRPEIWNLAASLYVGFVMIIAMFFAVKSVVFTRGGGAKKAQAH